MENTLNQTAPCPINNWDYRKEMKEAREKRVTNLGPGISIRNAAPDMDKKVEEIMEQTDLTGREYTNRMYRCMPAARWVCEAASRPNPVKLWHSLWFDGEISCLFADTNMGKSILAVQIAVDIARKYPKRNICYFDYEMSDKQFQMRYTSPETGEQFSFPMNLYRVQLKRNASNPDDITEIATAIRQVLTNTHCSIAIIDNLSWLANGSESGDVAGELMQQLMEMKRSMNLSMLVLAHTPKRNITAALTQNSLAGSKKLANFMDSMFAVGRNLRDKPAGRYIKQIKVRSCEEEYGADHVMVMSLAKEGCFLHMKHVGYATEVEMLTPQDSDEGEIRQKILDMSAEGQSLRQIASELSVSFSKVQRVVSAATPS